MVLITGTYEGGLRVRAVHGPSGCELLTDAPADNHGRGESFSPTDLVATAIGTCMLTIVAIAAEKKGLDVTGARFTVAKEMVADPRRRIGRLATTLHLPAALPPRERAALENAARACPVHQSLSPRTEVPLEFAYDVGAGPGRGS